MNSNKRYFCLEAARFGLDGGAMYGIIPRPMWSKVSPPDEFNRIELAMRLFLIETKDRMVLIDCGIGDHHDHKTRERFNIIGEKNPLVACLAQRNLKPCDITDLIISHLHFDHAGGIGTLLSDGTFIPTFEKATLHLHRDHYQYSLKATPRDQGSFWKHQYVPVIESYEKNNKIHWLQGAAGEIISDLGLMFDTSHGHTPHLIHPYDEQFIYLADIIPTSNHIHLPWVMGYDIAPAVTVADKERLLKKIIENNLTIIFEHDPKYWGSKVNFDGKKFIPKDLAPWEGKNCYSVF